MTETHFGFETVAAEEKASRVRGVFDSVASRYDLMNDLMSGGMHRLWKNAMVQSLPLYHNVHLLDLAGGTGDIAFRAQNYFSQKQKSLSITVCDINQAMLEEGKRRALDTNHAGIEWVCGDAEKLPLPSSHFDACTMAFGIRNVTNIPVALKEIHRVLKPGGVFLCLEFSKVTNPMLEKIYDGFSFNVIPKIGEKIVGDAAPYQYLVESIRRFPPQPEFAAMIGEAGFTRVKYENFAAGAVALHKGWKI
jgi:demethylmenaquinone methyltransferase / 2-methoxy-6-polyprenyl-1,4-benzoquinol methylase